MAAGLSEGEMLPDATRTVRLILVLLAIVTAGAVVIRAGQPPQFRTGIDLVTLNVTVTDAAGRYATHLGPDDFHIVEDGRLQEVSFFSRAATPLAISILIDTSGSMRRDLPLAKDAASEFVSRLQPHDMAQVAEFDRRLRVAQDFTSDKDALRRAIESIRLGNATSLYNAVYVALDLFRTLPSPSESEVRRDVIVLLSDGEDTSSLIEFDQMIEAARRSHVVVYAIGLGLTAPRGPAPRTHPLFALRRVTQDTGGRLFETRTGSLLSNVYNEIADELSSQYVIGYTSNSPSARGGWRPVSVRVTQPGLQARTRPGYFANRVPPGSGL